jgi:hypothetical protein
MEVYYIQRNVGKVKYVVNYHDGQKKHPDGSPFYDVQTYKNKKTMENFITLLVRQGYTQE